MGKGREGKGVWDPGQHKEKKIKRSRVPRIPYKHLSFLYMGPYRLLKLSRAEGSLGGPIKERNEPWGPV